eukprot:CAMPEP_0113652614 /NCGR_PEP_ID=MMETSP0017_2-20120614/28105_1 /TAXON_ID=2856 /ORGANISM="Cylindrotheca closterium" /LENGTH=61 /DNA_ID=CAMNT_0000565483 /DNA_START=982 /DNA_END=1167 /DNA_ORIENTATION=+ /assembly_acc=CAM_ASM_000147
MVISGSGGVYPRCGGNGVRQHKSVATSIMNINSSKKKKKSKRFSAKFNNDSKHHRPNNDLD